MVKSRMDKVWLWVFGLSLFQCYSALANQGLVIIDHVQSPQTDFALADLQQSHKDFQTGDHVHILLATETLKPQAYRIETNADGQVKIMGGDPVGAMYGVLDLAEQLTLTRDWSKIESKQRDPFIEKRGIKFNIPLDGRLPSYDDTGDAAQKNIKEMWSKDFWHAYLDDLARNRYNVLSLWTKHPFPSLIKLKDFPKVALDDVYTYAKEITPEVHKDWGGIDIFDPNNLKQVKRITIEEKIAFWQHVMQYAHDRGIEIFLFTWNIYVTGAEQYGIKPFDEAAVPYMRACVKEFALTYPHLAGMGVTAGEHLPMRVGKRTNVQWLYDTYGRGIMDAMEARPGRSIRFIFRTHHTNLPNIDRDFTKHFPAQVETSYKYSRAHMYSTPTPPYYEKTFGKDVEQFGYKCWMNIRNDGIFCFRWGDPDYVRTFMTKIATYPMAGFYIGSDGYVMGREFISKNPKLSGELENHKHWYREKLWGRLAYDPGLDKAFFLKTLSSRFPKVDAEALYSVWQTASRIIPTVQKFHWKSADELWDVEGCMSMVGFQTVRDFIDCFTYDDDDMVNIPTYAQALLANKAMPEVTPVQVSDTLLDLSNRCFSQLQTIQAAPPYDSEALKETLADIEAMAWLGQYYAYKIRGATELFLYEAISKPSDKRAHKVMAIDSLQKAVQAWQGYADNADRRYKPQLLARTRYLDWQALVPDVKNDVRIVETSSGELPKVTKIFCYEGQFSGPVTRLRAVLESNGYTPHQHPTWQISSFAYYRSRIVMASVSDHDNIYGRFLGGGGRLPDDFDTQGYALVKQGDIYWILGKDDAYTEKGIEALTDLIRRGDFDD
ncbi:hypothetical protein ACFL6U_10970 [Planctomycetota bacterium]